MLKHFDCSIVDSNIYIFQVIHMLRYQASVYGDSYGNDYHLPVQVFQICLTYKFTVIRKLDVLCLKKMILINEFIKFFRDHQQSLRPTDSGRSKAK